MEPATETNELVERIRHAANRENGLNGGYPKDVSATSQLPPIPEPLPLPPSPFFTATSAGEKPRPEILLDQAASMLRGGREKNAVPENVPKLLRPLFRNQGGFNSVLLEAVERLVEVNRNLRQQNYELHERMMDSYSWAHAVTQASAENRQWMIAVDARLQTLMELEARLALREKVNGPGESPAQSTSEQAQTDAA